MNAQDAQEFAYVIGKELDKYHKTGTNRDTYYCTMAMLHQTAVVHELRGTPLKGQPSSPVATNVVLI